MTTTIGGYLNLNESFNKVFSSNLVNLNESKQIEPNIYKIDFGYCQASGDWYDGSCIDNGVPYYEGEVRLSKKINNKFVDFLSDETKYDLLEFNNKESTDIIADIITLIFKDLNISEKIQDGFFFSDPGNAFVNECMNADKLIVSFINGKFKIIKKSGKGKWEDYSEFCEQD